MASFSKTEADRLDGVGLLPWRFRNNPRYELVEDEDVFRVVKKTPKQGKLDAIREKYTITKQEVQLEQIERHQTFQDDKLDKLFGKCHTLIHPTGTPAQSCHLQLVVSMADNTQ